MSEGGFTVSDWPPLRNTVVHACDNARPHTVYAATTVDFTESFYRIAELRRATRIAVSYHAYVLGCMAKAAHPYKMLHSLKQGQKLITFDSIDMGTIIDQHASDKLRTRLPVVHIIRDANVKSIAQINWEIRTAARTDLSSNPEVAARRKLTKLPYFAQKVMFRRLFRNPTLHRQFFGTMGFTSTQSPGYSHPLHGFVTNLHTSTVAMGNLHDGFLPDKEGKPALRRLLDLSGSFDHDFVDGMLLSTFGAAASKLIESCYGLDDEFIRETKELIAAQGA